MAADDLKRCTFELGGHAPVIVAADADVETAVKATLPFKFASAGQSCIAPSRFYLHRSRYAEFVDRFAAAAGALKVGNGREPGMQMGPVANARRLAAMERYTADATTRGARLVGGGRRLHNKGWFWAPTVLADVSDDAAVMNEEPFGPIAPMAPFDDFDEALARANRLAYGFAAYCFTRSLATAARFAEAIEADNIGINQMSPSLPDAPSAACATAATATKAAAPASRPSCTSSWSARRCREAARSNDQSRSVMRPTAIGGGLVHDAHFIILPRVDLTA